MLKMSPPCVPLHLTLRMYIYNLSSKWWNTKLPPVPGLECWKPNQAGVLQQDQTERLRAKVASWGVPWSTHLPNVYSMVPSRSHHQCMVQFRSPQRRLRVLFNCTAVRMIQAWTVCRNLKQVLVLCHPELAVHGCHVAGLEGWFRSSHSTLCGCCSRLGQQNSGDGRLSRTWLRDLAVLKCCSCFCCFQTGQPQDRSQERLLWKTQKLRWSCQGHARPFFVQITYWRR